MSDEWTFHVLDIAPTPYAAVPELTARLRVEAPEGLTVHAIALRCQVRIEPQRRGYEAEDEAGLRALFGDRDRWSQTLKPFQWMQCNTTVSRLHRRDRGRPGAALHLRLRRGRLALPARAG